MSVFLSWLAKEGAGLLLGALCKLFLDAWNTYQANQSQRNSAVAEVTTKINKESADAEKRANEVLVNRPDIDDALDKWSRGEKF